MTDKKKRIQSRYYRKIYEKHFGKIPDGFHIHHIDGNRNNNNIENFVCLSPEDHHKLHLEQGDMVATNNGKFIQGASEAGKIGGKSRSKKKVEACRRNMLKNRRQDVGTRASVEARRKAGTFFFSKEYQKEMQDRLRENKQGPYSDEHREMVAELGRNKGKKPSFNGETWNSSYEAELSTGVKASTIRYRCQKETKGWKYNKES